MTGFGKDPTNPFTNSIALLPNGNPNPMYSNNRQAPFFEFVANRLVLDPSDASGIPGYLDSLGNPVPPVIADPASSVWNRSGQSGQLLCLLQLLRQRRL